MNKKILFLILSIILNHLCFSQDFITENEDIKYSKDINYTKKRIFSSNLKEKYSGKEFTYTENIDKQKPKEPKKPKDSSFFKGLMSFMATFFPYLLGLIFVFIIIKTFINSEANFWSFGKSNVQIADKLIYEDDDNIENVDFDNLLKSAISNNNNRLAIRYYYLIVLKKLAIKKHIEYHKDKTNSEYLFELKNKKIKSEFSYLSYIYSYVWYGEFPVSEQKFNAIENKYKSFINNIN